MTPEKPDRSRAIMAIIIGVILLLILSIISPGYFEMCKIKKVMDSIARQKTILGLSGGSMDYLIQIEKVPLKDFFASYSPQSADKMYERVGKGTGSFSISGGI